MHLSRVSRPSRPIRRARRLLALAIATILVVVAGCGGDNDEPVTTTSEPTETPAADEPADGDAAEAEGDDDAEGAADEDGAPDAGATGTLSVRLEEVEGVFIEGFEIGVRIETPDGEVIDSFLWTEEVADLAAADIDAFYTAVLERSVPAGDVVVLADVNIGMGPAPETPDLEGPLPCSITVDVPADGSAAVEIAFSDTDCLRKA